MEPDFALLLVAPVLDAGHQHFDHFLQSFEFLERLENGLLGNEGRNAFPITLGDLLDRGIPENGMGLHFQLHKRRDFVPEYLPDLRFQREGFPILSVLHDDVLNALAIDPIPADVELLDGICQGHFEGEEIEVVR